MLKKNTATKTFHCLSLSLPVSRRIHLHVLSINHLVPFNHQCKLTVFWCFARHGNLHWLTWLNSSFGWRQTLSITIISYVVVIKLALMSHGHSATVPLHVIAILVIIHFVLVVLIHARQVEWTARLDFLWNLQVRIAHLIRWTFLVIFVSPFTLSPFFVPSLPAAWAFYYSSVHEKEPKQRWVRSVVLSDLLSAGQSWLKMQWNLSEEKPVASWLVIRIAVGHSGTPSSNLILTGA